MASKYSCWISNRFLLQLDFIVKLNWKERIRFRAISWGIYSHLVTSGNCIVLVVVCRIRTSDDYSVTFGCLLACIGWMVLMLPFPEWLALWRPWRCCANSHWLKAVVKDFRSFMLLQRRALVAHRDINVNDLSGRCQGSSEESWKTWEIKLYKVVLWFFDLQTAIYIHISFGIMHSPMCPSVSQQWSVGRPLGVVLLPMIVIWLILPVVICLSQRLSHACLSISTCTVKLRMAH